nr:MAG TPA: hypothetical protein [Caudoviricetes sp.]
MGRHSTRGRIPWRGSGEPPCGDRLGRRRRHDGAAADRRDTRGYSRNGRRRLQRIRPCGEHDQPRPRRDSRAHRDLRVRRVQALRLKVTKTDKHGESRDRWGCGSRRMLRRERGEWRDRLRGRRVEHDVRVPGVEIHGGFKLPAPAAVERVSERGVAPHPLAKLLEARLLRGEIDKAVPREYRQYIEIVREAPVHAVRAHVRRQVRRVHDEHRLGVVAEAVEKLAIVTRDDLETVQIARTRVIGRLADIVIEHLAAHIRDRQLILHREHQRRRQRDEIKKAVFAFLLFQKRENLLARFAEDGLVARELRGDGANAVKERVGARDIVDAPAVAVKIIVDDAAVWVEMLGDMREQPRAAEEVYEYRIRRILAYDFDEMSSEHTLLSHERQWCGKIQAAHTLRENRTSESPARRRWEASMLLTYIWTLARKSVIECSGRSICRAIR